MIFDPELFFLTFGRDFFPKDLNSLRFRNLVAFLQLRVHVSATGNRWRGEYIWVFLRFLVDCLVLLLHKKHPKDFQPT